MKTNTFFALALLLISILACSVPETKKVDTSKVEITITAKDLTKAYKDNEVAADGKYKGKVIAASGKVSNIAETFGNVTVSLEGHDIVISVMCSFDESQKSNVAKLKTGQQTTLVGVGDGMTGGLYVGLENCRVQ